MKLKYILNEVSLTPKAAAFLDAIQLSDRRIKDLRDVEVQATPKGNWEVFYKGKRLVVVNGKMLDDTTIRKYGLEKF